VRDAPSSPSMTPAVEHDDMMYPSAIPFVLVHLACIAAFWTGVTSQAVAICSLAADFCNRRWLSPVLFTPGLQTSRVFQFILAILSQSSAQKSVLWWASKHRHHHLYSDTQTDIHSPRHKGFIYSQPFACY
jgi:stearoyl-CoA desaturase (delta-9 desaturase)